MVGAVDERHVDVGAVEAAHGVEAAEPAADHHDPVPVSHRFSACDALYSAIVSSPGG